MTHWQISSHGTVFPAGLTQHEADVSGKPGSGQDIVGHAMKRFVQSSKQKLGCTVCHPQNGQTSPDSDPDSEEPAFGSSLGASVACGISIWSQPGTSIVTVKTVSVSRRRIVTFSCRRAAES